MTSTNQYIQRTTDVLNLINTHAATGITSRQMASMLRQEIYYIKNSVQTLMANQSIKSVGRNGRDSIYKPGANAMAATVKVKSAGLTTPDNGPGYTKPKPIGATSHAAAVLHVSRISMFDRSTYDGAELHRNPGIPDERFAAFDLPSMVNGIRVPPRRITAMCVGAAGPVALQASARGRFAA